MKIGEIYGTGKVVILSKGSYFIDGELTNIAKLREYDKAGILQWESSELRELALGLEADNKSKSGQVSLQSSAGKEPFWKRLVRGFVASDESKGWQIAGYAAFIIWAAFNVLIAVQYLLFRGGFYLWSLLTIVFSLGIGGLLIFRGLYFVKVLAETAEKIIGRKRLLIVVASLGVILLAGVSYAVVVERDRAVEWQRIRAVTPARNAVNSSDGARGQISAITMFGVEYVVYAAPLDDFPHLVKFTFIAPGGTIYQGIVDPEGSLGHGWLERVYLTSSDLERVREGVEMYIVGNGLWFRWQIEQLLDNSSD